jgi:hypothetical protein
MSSGGVHGIPAVTNFRWHHRPGRMQQITHYGTTLTARLLTGLAC